MCAISPLCYGLTPAQSAIGVWHRYFIGMSEVKIRIERRLKKKYFLNYLFLIIDGIATIHEISVSKREDVNISEISVKPIARSRASSLRHFPSFIWKCHVIFPASIKITQRLISVTCTNAIKDTFEELPRQLFLLQILLCRKVNVALIACILLNGAIFFSMSLIIVFVRHVKDTFRWTFQLHIKYLTSLLYWWFSRWSSLFIFSFFDEKLDKKIMARVAHLLQK